MLLSAYWQIRTQYCLCVAAWASCSIDTTTQRKTDRLSAALTKGSKGMARRREGSFYAPEPEGLQDSSPVFNREPSSQDGSP